MNIGKTNTCYLKEDKTSAEVVKKYQCLYEKSFPEYEALYKYQFEVFYIHFVKEMN